MAEDAGGDDDLVLLAVEEEDVDEDPDGPESQAGEEEPESDEGGEPETAKAEADADADAEADADADDEPSVELVSDEGDAGTELSLGAATEPSGTGGAPAAGESEKGCFLVLVDGVTDPHNLGAILRSAECAGATGVVIPRHRAAHVTPAVTKAAAGAIEHLPMALVAGIPSALQDLSRLGVTTVGLDERGEADFFDVVMGDRPIALVLGAEGAGLGPLARRRCDVLAKIPLTGAIPSLNVSAAAAVACFEVARQRRG